MLSAAAAKNLSLRELVLASVLERAEQTLPKRRSFGHDAERWRGFLSARDVEPREVPKFRSLLSIPSVFEQHA